MNGPLDFDLDLDQLADIERYVAGAPDPEPVDPEGIRPFSYPIGDRKAAEGQASGFQATALASLDLDLIPPRRWLYGRELLRGFVSVQVAHRAGCAVWLVHHFRKGGQAGDSESFRGAGAIQGAARVMSTLSAMSKDEAAKLNIPDDKRRSFVRLDNAKANMGPPAESAEWYQLVGINIGNATEEYPDGDSVQSVEPWAPPTTWGDLPFAMIVQILEQIERGPSAGERYALGKQAKVRWAGNVVMEMADKSEFQAVSILKSWKDNGVIVEGEYRSPALRHKTTGGITVSLVKLAEMRQAAASYPPGDDDGR